MMKNKHWIYFCPKIKFVDDSDVPLECSTTLTSKEDTVKGFQCEYCQRHYKKEMSLVKHVSKCSIMKDSELLVLPLNHTKEVSKYGVLYIKYI